MLFTMELGQMLLLLQVTKVDLKKETPVGHGEIISFSIYSFDGERKADFGDGKCCIWVDVLDGEGCTATGEKNLLMEFAPFFEDKSIKKVHSFIVIIFYPRTEFCFLFPRVNALSIEDHWSRYYGEKVLCLLGMNVMDIIYSIHETF